MLRSASKAVFASVFLASAAFAADPAAGTRPFEVLNVPLESVQASEPGKLTLLEYRKSAPPKVRFRRGAALLNCSLDSKVFRCADGATLALPAGSFKPVLFELGFEQDGKPEKYRIQVLPDDFPSYRFEGQSRLAKSILLSPVGEGGDGAGHLLVLDPSGDIRFYRRLKQNAVDFKPHPLPGGRLLYSYLRVDSGSELNAWGHRVLLDRNFNVLRTLPEKLDMHEFRLLSDDHFLATYYEKGRTPLGKCIVEQGFREYRKDKLVFQVSTMELFKKGLLYRKALIKRFEGEDCMAFFHPNSADILDASHLLLGVGDSILNYDKRRGKIEWVLGGLADQFRLPTELNQLIFLVHSPIWDPRSRRLTLFDNSPFTKSSRILEYKLDIAKRQIDRFENLFENGIYADYMGSVETDESGGEQVLSIGWGHKRAGDPAFSEVSDKKEHLKLTFADPSLYTYKIYRW